jgi:hypothetical protein
MMRFRASRRDLARVAIEPSGRIESYLTAVRNSANVGVSVADATRGEMRHWDDAGGKIVCERLDADFTARAALVVTIASG